VSPGSESDAYVVNHALIERAAQAMSKESKMSVRNKTDFHVVNYLLLERAAQAMSKEPKK
jgi:hypothetical protein